MTHCAACGYLQIYHDPGTLRCPAETANSRGSRGTFKVPPPVERIGYADIIRRDAEARRRAIDEARKPYELETIPPPLVPARLPCGPDEYATATRGISAQKLGRKAMDLGWLAEPAYWMAHDGTEGCAVRLAKGPLRAVATWARESGRWTPNVAFAWRTDVARFPVKVTHTDLERLIQ